MNRRHMLERAAASGLAAIVGLSASTGHAVQIKRNISPPSIPKCLTRTVVRELSSGTSIIVERSWQVEFQRLAPGWVVKGRQVAVDVRAPQQLAQLADIERSRETSESFPLKLDESGLIVQADDVSTQLDMSKVAAAAREVVEARGGNPTDHRALGAFLGQLQSAAGAVLSVFPQDLFFPVGDDFTQTKQVAFDGGLTGEVELSYSARTRPGSTLLAASMRTVTSRIGGSEMRSIERWQLESA